MCVCVYLSAAIASLQCSVTWALLCISCQFSGADKNFITSETSAPSSNMVETDNDFQPCAGWGWGEPHRAAVWAPFPKVASEPSPRETSQKWRTGWVVPSVAGLGLYPVAIFQKDWSQLSPRERVTYTLQLDINNYECFCCLLCLNTPI